MEEQEENVVSSSAEESEISHGEEERVDSSSVEASKTSHDAASNADQDEPSEDSGRLIKPETEVAVRSQSNFWGYLITALLGAILGISFTLTLLLLLNGTLRLNQSGQINKLQQDALQTAEIVQTEQAALHSELVVLQEQYAALSTRESELSGELATVQTDLDETNNELADSTKEISTIKNDTSRLERRLTTAIASAEKFETFLIGLRDLLGGIPELAAPPDITVTKPAIESPATGTPTINVTSAVEGTPKSTITTTAKPLPVATRTPRPTATAIGSSTTGAPTTD